MRICRKKFFAFAPHRIHDMDPTRNPTNTNQDNENTQVVLDAAMLERIIQAAVTTAVQADRTVRRSVDPPAPIAVLEKALQWNDFPKWPGKCDRIDAWFQSMEAKLKAARIPEEKWASKLMECPKVGDELKRRLAGLPDPSYKGIRMHCLQIYGPVDPVGYFRSQIFSVKGTTREDVMDKLEDARALHNRAARLEGKHEWEDGDLLYPFINAFPEEVATKLKQELASAIRNGSPLQELVSRAPSVGDSAVEENKVLPLVGQVEGRNQKRQVAETGLVAEIRELKKALKSSMAGNRPRPPFVTPKRPPTVGQRCGKCGGGSCTGGTECPARNRECFICKRIGHFRSTCRAPQDAQDGRQQLGVPPFMNGQDRR